MKSSIVNTPNNTYKPVAAVKPQHPVNTVTTNAVPVSHAAPPDKNESALIFIPIKTGQTHFCSRCGGIATHTIKYNGANTKVCEVCAKKIKADVDMQLGK